MRRFALLALGLLVAAAAFPSYNTGAFGDKLTGTFGSAFDEPFSMGCWTKRTAAQWADTGDDRMLSIGDDTADVNSTHIIQNSSEADTIAAWSWNTAAASDEAKLNFANGTYDDVWVLVVGVYASDTDRRIYIETSGNTAQSTVSRTLNAVDEIHVGGPAHTDSLGWAGLVGHCFVFNKALTTGEIDALQTGAETGVCPCDVASGNCIGYWPMTVDQASHADESTVGSGPTLAVQSSAPFSADNPTIAACSTGGAPLLLNPEINQ